MENLTFIKSSKNSAFEYDQIKVLKRVLSKTIHHEADKTVRAMSYPEYVLDCLVYYEGKWDYTTIEEKDLQDEITENIYKVRIED